MRRIKKILSFNILLPLIALLMCCGNVKAQDMEYGVEVDTNMIVIGDRIHFKFLVNKPNNIKVEFPQLNDTIVKGLEILEKKPLDSLETEKGWRQFTQEYVATSFDTGVYHIPSFEFTVKGKNFDNVVRSKEFYVGVVSFAVDTEKGFFDIMLPIDTPLSFKEILPYIYWAIAAAMLILLIVMLWRKFRKKEAVFVKKEKPKDPPHLIALSDLDKIKKDSLWQKGRVKEYYTRVTEVLRVYLEDQFGINALEKITTEIVDDVKNEPLISDVLTAKLEDILVRADFVKFAKAEPLPDENHKTITDAYEIVTKSRKAYIDKKQREKEQREKEEEERRLKEEEELNKAEEQKTAEAGKELKAEKAEETNKESIKTVKEGTEEKDHSAYWPEQKDKNTTNKE